MCGADLEAAATCRASLGATRAMRQDQDPGPRNPTAGYTIVDAHLAYHIDAGRTSWEFFLDGNNLVNEHARVATSFLKDRVMLPGRNFSLGVRAYFRGAPGKQRPKSMPDERPYQVPDHHRVNGRRPQSKSLAEWAR